MLPLPTGDWALRVATFGTMVIESSVPLLLMIRRTRFLGFLLGVVFHLFIAVTPVIWISDFSSILFALFLLFTPASFTDRMIENLRRVFDWLGTKGAISVRLALVAMCVVIVISLLTRSIEVSSFLIEFHRPILFTMFGAYAWMFLFLVIASIKHGKNDASVKRQPSLRSAIRSPATCVLLGIAVLNGLCPYLGFKTVGCFAMFSNLRTEMGRSNHFFMPQIYLCDWQHDFVEIRNSSDRWLQHCAEKRWMVSRFELRKKARQDSEISLRYVTKGNEVEVDRLGNSPDFFAPDPMWKTKLLRFRPVPVAGPSPALGS